ncbi:hypothetical protein D9756_001093 [Leucocoprinus leucothites]|uniref:Fungal-type protein kinase domain-containing protein n=1 Tax=Leucocoprinus leucothites TaxID=201217 RepID=A0A8H5GE60_9AGAR|nr:hypothetical protein D9756_001093 [Leucoagaricus leucothites]
MAVMVLLVLTSISLSPTYFLLTTFALNSSEPEKSTTNRVRSIIMLGSESSSSSSHIQSSIPVTPPRSLDPGLTSVASAISDTPRSAKGDLGAVAQHKIRSEIAEQMAPELLRCPINVFFSHYSPFNPDNDLVDSAVSTLKKENHLTSTGNWRPGTFASITEPPARATSKKASEKTPDDSKHESEAVVFSKLTQIIKDMVPQDGNNDDRTRRFFYTDCGNKVVEGDISGGGFKPDAFVLRNEYTGGKITLSDAAVVAEFKKSNDPEVTRDNRLKIISAASHIMNNDPCRMWTYGVQSQSYFLKQTQLIPGKISIEKDMMSVWYFSRSHSVKTDGFNWIEDPRTFIKVFVSFLFAKELEIGFDPSVRRVTYRTKERFIYEIKAEGGTRYYRTINPIFNPRVACVTGRKTRVWEAEEVRPINGSFTSVEVVEKGKRVALKDVWLDEGSQTERQIQKAIFDKLKQVRDEDYEWATEGYLRPLIKEALTDFPRNLPFMQIECDGWGKETRERHAEAVADPAIIPAKNLESSALQSAMHTNKKSTMSRPSGASNRPNSVSSRPQYGSRDYIGKKQYRLVYSSVGYALHDAEDLSTSFKAIMDVSTALVLMFLAGWVHRDVSTGNIIVVNVGGHVRGLLSDLEYAREFGRINKGASDPKTGTPFFMPVEIHLGYKLRFAEDDPQDLDSLDHEEDSSVESGGISKNLKAVFFFHHDLESLMWIGLWVVLGKIVEHASSGKVFSFLFTNDSNPGPFRYIFFQGANQEVVRDAFHPKLRKKFFSSFNVIRVWLCNFCSSPKYDNPTKSDFETLFNRVSRCFQTLAQDADKFNDDVKFIPPPRDLHPPLQEQLPPDDDDRGTTIGQKGNKGKEKVDTEKASSQSQQSSTSRKRKNSEPQRMSMRLRKRPNTD